MLGGVFNARRIVRAASVALSLAACSSENPNEQGATSSGGAGASASSTHAAASTGAQASTTGAATNSASAGAGGSGAGAGAGDEGGSACRSSSGGGPSDGGASSGGCAKSSPFVTRVVGVCFGPGAGFGQEDFPNVVYGPPLGGGAEQGSLDVLSLGNGGSITLGFDVTIVDGPGPDFIVFENPFDVGNNPKDPYADPGTVAVSEDGVHWIPFPCTATKYPWGSCAGWHPVFANAHTNSIDPLDPKTAGGDAFDLHDIGVSRARFVRITDRPDIPGDFDLDAVAVVNSTCP